MRLLGQLLGVARPVEEREVGVAVQLRVPAIRPTPPPVGRRRYRTPVRVVQGPVQGGSPSRPTHRRRRDRRTATPLDGDGVGGSGGGVPDRVMRAGSPWPVVVVSSTRSTENSKRVCASRSASVIGICDRSARNCATSRARSPSSSTDDRRTRDHERVLVVVARERVHRVAAVALEVAALRSGHDEREQPVVGQDRAHRVQPRPAVGTHRREEREPDPDPVEVVTAGGREVRSLRHEVVPGRHRRTLPDGNSPRNHGSGTPPRGLGKTAHA